MAHYQIQCPYCGSEMRTPLPLFRLRDVFFLVFGFRPNRCGCGERFYVNRLFPSITPRA